MWHEPQEALNKRFPRLTCSADKTKVLPEPSRAIVRVAEEYTRRRGPTLVWWAYQGSWNGTRPQTDEQGTTNVSTS